MCVCDIYIYIYVIYNYMSWVLWSSLWACRRAFSTNRNAPSRPRQRVSSEAGVTRHEPGGSEAFGAKKKEGLAATCSETKEMKGLFHLPSQKNEDSRG